MASFGRAGAIPRTNPDSSWGPPSIRCCRSWNRWHSLTTHFAATEQLSPSSTFLPAAEASFLFRRQTPFIPAGVTVMQGRARAPAPITPPTNSSSAPPTPAGAPSPNTAISPMARPTPSSLAKKPSPNAHGKPVACTGTNRGSLEATGESVAVALNFTAILT